MDDGAIIAHTSACDRGNGGGQSESAAFRKSRRAASVTDDETWVDAEHANTLNAFDQGDVRTTHAVVEQASTLQAGGGERGNRLDAEMAAGGQLVAETIMGDVTHALTRAASKATTEDGTGRGAPIVAETFSVYPEGGNGADIAASPAERSPSLTKVKSERGIHVAERVTVSTQNQRDEVRDLGTAAGALAAQPGMKQQTFIREHMTVRRLTPVECERLMGWPDNFTAPPGVKAPDSKRYAACGDGIVAPVAFWIADRIRMIEEEGGI